MNLPYFSRVQLGVIVLLSAALLSVYAWRANFWQAPAPPAAQPLEMVFVEVTGAVPRPGVYAFNRPPALLEALERAGAPPISVPSNPALVSGSRVEMSKEGSHAISRISGPQLLTLGLALDLNTATASDLEALPGIGPVFAARIVQYREAHGPFKNIDELAQVSGIGPKKLEQIKPLLMLAGSEVTLPDDRESGPKARFSGP